MSGRQLLLVACSIAACVAALARAPRLAVAQGSSSSSPPVRFLITAEGMAGLTLGMSIADVTPRLGAVREIAKSEIEAREYITFQRQPKGLRFRLDGAKIFSIAVQSAE